MTELDIQHAFEKLAHPGWGGVGEPQQSTSRRHSRSESFPQMASPSPLLFPEWVWGLPESVESSAKSKVCPLPRVASQSCAVCRELLPCACLSRSALSPGSETTEALPGFSFPI